MIEGSEDAVEGSWSQRKLLDEAMERYERAVGVDLGSIQKRGSKILSFFSSPQVNHHRDDRLQRSLMHSNGEDSAGESVMGRRGLRLGVGRSLRQYKDDEEDTDSSLSSSIGR